MSTLSLARVLFAVTAGTHFLFVALTLGLAAIVAITQTRATTSGSAVHQRMVRYWGQLYIINYGVGIVTGLVMELQFGLNWPGLTDHARDVFGAPLALETLIGFFIESTFLGLWIFGWDKLNRWAHLALIWIVTLTAYASAYFVLVANGFLRRPVGYTRVGEALRIDDVAALFGNKAALLPLGHIVAGAFLVAGFFMAGISAWHLRRARSLKGRPPTDPNVDVEFFRRSMRIGLTSAAVAVLPSAMLGVVQFGVLARKNAAPTWAEASAGLMMSAWTWLFLVAVAGVIHLPFRRWLLDARIFHRVLMATLPVPYVAMLTGWLYREGSRQPWLIQGVLRTEDAVRPMSLGAMTASFTGITALILALAVVNIALLRRYARLGPDGSALGAEPTRPTRPDPVPAL